MIVEVIDVITPARGASTPPVAGMTGHHLLFRDIRAPR